MQNAKLFIKKNELNSINIETPKKDGEMAEWPIASDLKSDEAKRLP